MSSAAPTTSERVDLVDGLGVLARRWYVVVPALLLTAVVALVVVNDTTTTYQQTTNVAVTSPSVILTRVQPEGTANQRAARNVRTTVNALTDKGGTGLVANLAVLQMGSEEFERSIDDQAPGTTFTTGLVENASAANTSLPVIALTAEAESAGAATRALTALSDGAASSIRSVQLAAGVPTDRLASSFVVTTDPTPSAVETSRARAAGAVVVAGVVLTVALTALVDAILVRRRRRSGDHAASTYSAASTAG